MLKVGNKLSKLYLSIFDMPDTERQLGIILSNCRFLSTKEFFVREAFFFCFVIDHAEELQYKFKYLYTTCISSMVIRWIIKFTQIL